MLTTLTQHLGPLDEQQEEPELSMTASETLEAGVISGFMSIFGMLYSIRECEYYFRRYPFKSKNISRSDYLRNCCEMLFDRIAQLRDRLKISLNAIQKEQPKKSIPVGKVIKLFGASFQGPLRLRNWVHHHDRYSDEEISQLSVVDLLSKAQQLQPAEGEGESTGPPMTALLNQKGLYQRAARRWIARIDNYEKSAEAFVEIVSQIVLDECDFIRRFVSDEDAKRLAKCKRYEI